MTDKFSNISTLVDLLRFRVNKHPDRVAYTFLPDGEGNGISLTYAELDKKARSIAVELQRSYHRGSRAILAYPSGLDFICAFFGCVYAGIIAVPAYPPKRNQKLDRFKSIIDDSKPSVILSKSNIVNKIKPMYKEDLSLKDLPWVSTETISEDNAKDYWENLVNADDIVFLQYTSGSTAKPKGVMITHENIIYNELMLQSAINLSEDSIAVGWSPLFHDMGLIGQVLSPIYMGMRLYFMAPISFLQKPICWIKAVSDYKATVTLAPNFAYELCARQITDEQKQGLNLSHLKIALSGSEPVNSSTMDRFYEAFSPYGLKRETLYPAYGLAEVTLFATGGERGDLQVYKSLLTNELERNRVVLTGNEGNNGKGTKILVGNGKPWLDEKIVIADPETNATKPVGEIGEILISGKNVAKGYWNNPEATKQTFQAYLSDTGDGPFLRTGDSGFIFNGSLFVTGRIKDMIIIRGQNYYPQDIEWTVDEISFDVNGTRPIRVGACGAFSTEVNGEEKLIVAIEVNSGYLTGLRDILKDRESIAGNACSVHQKTSNKTSQSHGDADVLPPEVIANAIRKAVAEEHELSVYDVVLLRPYSIPMTSSGKIQRHRLRHGYETGEIEKLWALKDTEPVRDESVEDQCEKLDGCDKDICKLDRWLVSKISLHLKIPSKEMDNKRDLFTYGIDSLMVVQIMADLQSALGHSLEERLFYEYPTIEKLAAYIACEAPVISETPLKLPSDRITPVSDDVLEISAKETVVLDEIDEQYYRFDKFPKYIEWSNRLALWESLGIRNPYFQVNNGMAGSTMNINGSDLINFATFNYLGLSCDSSVCNASIDAIKTYGTSVSATNPITGLTPLHKKLERVLAEFLNCEDSLVLPSGFGTNETIVGTLVGSGDLIVHDLYMHMSAVQGSLLSGARKITFPHNDWEALDAILKKERAMYKKVLILIEGTYSMDGDIPNLPKIIEIKKRHKALLMIDEAHSIGVLGKNGGGVGEHYNVNRSDVDVWMGTLSKAIGSCGGYIAGSKELIKYLRLTTPGYIFGTSITPANTAAAIASLETIKKEPYRVARLHYLSSLFLTLAKEKGLNTGTSNGTAIIPVIIGDSIKTLKLANAIFDRGILAMPILFPAVSEDATRVRFFVMANHTEEQIHYAVNTAHEEFLKLK